MKLSSLSSLNAPVDTLKRLRAARMDFRAAHAIFFAARDDSRATPHYLGDSQILDAFRDFMEIEESKLVERIRRLGVEVDT